MVPLDKLPHPQVIKQSQLNPWYGCYKAWGLYKKQTEETLKSMPHIEPHDPTKKIKALEPILNRPWLSRYSPNYLMIQVCIMQSKLLAQTYYLYQNHLDIPGNDKAQIDSAYEMCVARAIELHMVKEFAKDPDNIFMSQRVLWATAIAMTLVLIAASVYSTLLLCVMLGPAACLGFVVTADAHLNLTQALQALDELELAIAPNGHIPRFK